MVGEPLSRVVRGKLERGLPLRHPTANILAELKLEDIGKFEGHIHHSMIV